MTATMTSPAPWQASPAQVQLLRNVFAERVPNDEPNREAFWRNCTQVTSNASFDSVLRALKSRPLAQTPKPAAPAPVQPVAPVLPELAKEDGLYRDPSDGTLYRLSTPQKRNAWDAYQTPIVSVYSNKATIRRLTPEGRLVKKGKWTRLRAYESRSLIGYSRWERLGKTEVGKKVLASWIMDDEERTVWAVGICLICYKGLTDGVSVYNQIGPVCARNLGVALQMPPVESSLVP